MKTALIVSGCVVAAVASLLVGFHWGFGVGQDDGYAVGFDHATWSDPDVAQALELDRESYGLVLAQRLDDWRSCELFADDFAYGHIDGVLWATGKWKEALNMEQRRDEDQRGLIRISTRDGHERHLDVLETLVERIGGVCN